MLLVPQRLLLVMEPDLLVLEPDLLVMEQPLLVMVVLAMELELLLPSSPAIAFGFQAARYSILHICITNVYVYKICITNIYVYTCITKLRWM